VQWLSEKLQKMQQAHHEGPAEIGITLDSFTEVRNQAVALRPVVRIAHRYHGIIEKAEISFAFDHATGTVNKIGGIKGLQTATSSTSLLLWKVVLDDFRTINKELTN
jgi:hypothetical protein